MSSHRFRNLLASLVSSHICSGIYSPLCFFFTLFRNLLASLVLLSHLVRNLLGSRVYLLDLSRLFHTTRLLLRVSVSGITRFSRVLRLLRYQVFVFLHPFRKSLGPKESVLPHLFRNIRISLVSFLLYTRCSE